MAILNMNTGPGVKGGAPGQLLKHFQLAKEAFLLSYGPQRGGCLTIFLVGVLLANGLAALSGVGQSLLMTLAIARIVFALAIWSWLRWGAYGYGVVTVFLTAAYLLIGDFSTAFVAVLDLAILAYLLREPWPLME